jgi:hypothetical protein
MLLVPFCLSDNLMRSDLDGFIDLLNPVENPFALCNAIASLLLDSPPLRITPESVRGSE